MLALRRKDVEFVKIISRQTVHSTLSELKCLQSMVVWLDRFIQGIPFSFSTCCCKVSVNVFTDFHTTVTWGGGT